MIKSKGLSAMAIGTITATWISAIFWLYMASVLGSEKYGEVNYLISIAIIATTISIFGANPTIVVYTAKGQKVAPILFILAGLSGLIASIIIFFIFNSVGTSLLIIGSVVFGLVTSELIGKGLYKKYVKYLILQKILMVGFSISLYYLLGLEGVVIGIALSQLPFTLLMYKGIKSGSIKLSILKPKRFFMINNYSLEISRIFGGNIDKLIIAPLLGFALLGNYQLGFQFFLLISILPAIVYQYSLPQDSKGITNYGLKRKTIILSICISILGFIFAPYLISNLFPTYLEAIQIIQIMIFALIPKTINLMNTSYLLGKEKSKFVLIGVTIYLVSQISLILILGELYGINGVASSLIIALSIESLFLHMAKKYVDSNEKESF